MRVRGGVCLPAAAGPSAAGDATRRIAPPDGHRFDQSRRPTAFTGPPTLRGGGEEKLCDLSVSESGHRHEQAPCPDGRSTSPSGHCPSHIVHQDIAHQDIDHQDIDL